MEEDKRKNTENVINVGSIIKEIRNNIKLFCKVIAIVFVLSCAYILCIPRYYSTNLSLAPEMENSGGSGFLSSITSTFGINLDNLQTSDAISPTLYPDLMEDNKFVVDLFSIRVESADGEIKCSYFDYLKNHSKRPWWQKPIGLIRKLFKPKGIYVANSGKDDPYILSMEKDLIAETIRNNIGISVSNKTGVITINVEAQDPLICKTLADSLKERLQLFITDYRTNKARIDLEYYKKLCDEARGEYDKARKEYSRYSDANNDLTMIGFRGIQEDLENDMQLKYTIYSTLMAQYNSARAKVQERTPAFTVVKGASVPVKPAGPKRMIFVIVMSFLAFTFTLLYVIKDNLLSGLK